MVAWGWKQRLTANGPQRRWGDGTVLELDVVRVAQLYIY